MKKLAFLLCLMPSLAGASGIFNPGSGGSAASGGASSLQVTQSGVEITSPTASINFRSGDFKVRSIGTTSYVLLDPGATNYIHNQTTAQSATFSVSSGTASDQFNTKQLHFLATACVATALDGTCIMSFPSTQDTFYGYNTNLVNTGGVFNTAVGAAAMPYPGSGNFNTCIGNSCMSGNVITTAENNNSMGYASCGALRAGFYNNCMGGSAGNKLRDGNYNAYVGAYAGRENVDNNGNVCMGFESCRDTTADFVTSIGYQACQGTATVNANTLGTHLTCIGKNTGQDVGSATALTNSFAVGDGALYHASNEGQLGGRLGSGFETLVRMASGTVETSYFKVNGKNVCLADGTNCPAAAASEFKVSLSTGTFGIIGISTQTNLTATGSANLNVNAVNVGPISLSTGVVGVLPVANGGHSEFLVSLSTGTIGFLISSVTNTYVFSSTSTVALANAAGGAFSVTLPTAVGIAGKVYRIKRTNSGANAVTIATTAAQTIDGASTQTLTVQYASIDVISDGANWFIL